MRGIFDARRLSIARAEMYIAGWRRSIAVHAAFIDGHELFVARRERLVARVRMGVELTMKFVIPSLRGISSLLPETLQRFLASSE
jgi:hypothetical protein